jgi:hypothetical protein
MTLTHQQIRDAVRETMCGATYDLAELIQCSTDSYFSELEVASIIVQSQIDKGEITIQDFVNLLNNAE